MSITTSGSNVEMLALVDHNDELIGQISREDAFDYANLGNGGYLRGVTALVMNSAGAIWIPTRQEGLEVAPGGLDYSMAGKVRQEESHGVSRDTSYMNAAVREFKEELKRDIGADELELFAWTGPATNDIPYFMRNYVFRSDETPKYNPKDYSGGEWLYPEDLLARLAAGHKAKHGMQAITKHLQHYEAERTGNK